MVLFDIPLTELQVANGGSAGPSADGLKLVTAAPRWAYSLMRQVLPTTELMSGPVVVKIQLHVTTGAIGILVSAIDDISNSIDETIVKVSDRSQIVNIEIPEVSESGMLIFRNTSPVGASEAIIQSIQVERQPDSALATTLPFKDDFAKDVQIVAREGADTVLLVFCGAAHNVGISLDHAHRWFTRHNASVVYLRDMRNRNYLSGIKSLGADTLTTAARLRKLIASLGAKKIACFGGSAALFGAMLYGLELKAHSVLCLGGATNLSPEFNEYSEYLHQALRLRAELPDTNLDIREHYVRAAVQPRVFLVYSSCNWDDRRYAEHLATVPSVALMPIEGVEKHNVIEHLVETGEFSELIDKLVPRLVRGRKSLVSPLGPRKVRHQI